MARPKRDICKNGHKYTPETTTVVARGRYKGERRCRLCIEQYKATKEQKRKEASAARAARRAESWFF